jgi:hypothetical protein
MKQYRINSIGVRVLGVPQGTVIKDELGLTPNPMYWVLIP